MFSMFRYCNLPMLDYYGCHAAVHAAVVRSLALVVSRALLYVTY